MATTRIYQRKTAEVLVAAEELFLRSGHGNTSMRAVATRAGVAKATAYSNSPTRGLYLRRSWGGGARAAPAALRAECSRVDIDHVDLDSRDTRATLVELATAFLVDIYSREQVELFRTVVADSRRFPQLGKMMLEGPFLETHGKITDYFGQLLARGELDVAIALPGIHQLSFSQEANGTPRVVRAIATDAVDIFLNGARPKKNAAATDIREKA